MLFRVFRGNVPHQAFVRALYQQRARTVSAVCICRRNARMPCCTGFACTASIASSDKGNRTCGPDRNAICCVIALAIRPVCPHPLPCRRRPSPGGKSTEFFTEDKRRLTRQTRQVGCRPGARITTPDAVLTREKPCLPFSADAIIRNFILKYKPLSLPTFLFRQTMLYWG